jgi:hypothetical protein
VGVAGQQGPGGRDVRREAAGRGRQQRQVLHRHTQLWFSVADLAIVFFFFFSTVLQSLLIRITAMDVVTSKGSALLIFPWGKQS